MSPAAKRVAMLLGMGFLGSCSTQPAPRAADPALSAQLAQLEARRERLADLNAIRKLQRAWGYYLDEGQWDDAADLFAGDATIEIGFDGVYRGRERIREYLRAGNARKGLAPGELNEHFQLMPVITLDPGGTSARGTWRDVILKGHLGANDAHWGEGPYENTYVKEGGIWKIRSLHWFQTLYVPYDGGWAKHGDDNAGRFVGDRLKPDAPPTVSYKTWPGAFTPPFHFRGQVPYLAPVPLPAGLPALSSRELSARIAKLAAETARLSARDDIENLQGIYGYYIDKSQWSDAASLFTEDAEFTVQGLGTWRGREGVRRYLLSTGAEGLQPNRLYDNMQLQPIIDVAADGNSARGRWHLFSQLAQHGAFHEWSTGVQENEYVRRDGVWMIRRMHLYPTMITPYEDGWSRTSLSRSRFDANARPDAAASGPSSLYGTAFVTPFHYDHPVRGDPPVAASQPAADPVDPAAALAALDRQIGLIEDHAQIENLQRVYGYYLATLLWDDLAALFAEDGTIEIAMRGIYVGRPAVRRNLNLYGQAGLDDGVLHNHMQYQPVIHVAPDGRSAKLRSRALSMMGNFGRNGTWMGGIYENEFVKIGGRWYFQKDQQINTYFAPYETGWKDLPQRAPPGITASNPPDRPPSFPFDFYPKNFLPPYHYPNPVTSMAHP